MLLLTNRLLRASEGEKSPESFDVSSHSMSAFSEISQVTLQTAGHPLRGPILWRSNVWIWVWSFCWQHFPLHACDYQLLLSSWRHNLSKTPLLFLELLSLFFPREWCVLSKGTVLLSLCLRMGRGEPSLLELCLSKLQLPLAILWSWSFAWSQLVGTDGHSGFQENLKWPMCGRRSCQSSFLWMV